MKNQTAKTYEAGVHTCDFWQDSSGNHDRQGSEAADETGGRSPSQRAEDMKAGTFDFSIEWIRLDEQTNPNLVNSSVGDTKNQPIQDVSDQRAKHGSALLRRPIER